MKNNKQMEGKLPSSDISSWITLPSHEQQQTNALQCQFEQFIGVAGISLSFGVAGRHCYKPGQIHCFIV